MKSACLAAWFLCALNVGAPAAETVETLQKKLDGTAAKVTVLICQQRSVIDSDMGNGGSLKKDETGPLEFMKQGGKIMWRMESKGRQIQKGREYETKLDIDDVQFDDGEHSWMILDSGGKKKAFKLKMRQTIHPLADKSFFADERKDNTLKVQADEPIDGKPCFVLDSSPTMFANQKLPGMGMTRYWIQQDTGIIVKSVTNDGKAKPMMTTTRTQIKLNAAIPPDRFQPPAGAEIVDMTKS